MLTFSIKSHFFLYQVNEFTKWRTKLVFPKISKTKISRYQHLSKFSRTLYYYLWKAFRQTLPRISCFSQAVNVIHNAHGLAELYIYISFNFTVEIKHFKYKTYKYKNAILCDFTWYCRYFLFTVIYLDVDKHASHVLLSVYYYNKKIYKNPIGSTNTLHGKKAPETMCREHAIHSTRRVLHTTYLPIFMELLANV